jgi:hypothetical protein
VLSFGTYHDTVTGWTISVGETNGIHIGPRTNSALLGIVKFSTTVSPSGWRPHTGWFAYAESAERVWVFDGERELMVLEATPKEWGFHVPPFRYSVPAEVLGRLPEPVRQSVGKHDEQPPMGVHEASAK